MQSQYYLFGTSYNLEELGNKYHESRTCVSNYRISKVPICSVCLT